MAKREQKFDKPACGACGKLTRPMGDKMTRWRACENGHRIYKKRGA